MKPANQNTHKARMSKTGDRMPPCFPHMKRYNNILRPHDPPCDPHDPTSPNLGVATPQAPRIDAYGICLQLNRIATLDGPEAIGLISESTGGCGFEPGFEYHLWESTRALFYRVLTFCIRRRNCIIAGNEARPRQLESKSNWSCQRHRRREYTGGESGGESGGDSVVRRTNRRPLSYRRMRRNYFKARWNRIICLICNAVSRTATRSHQRKLWSLGQWPLDIGTMATGHWDNGHWSLWRCIALATNIGLHWI